MTEQQHQQGGTHHGAEELGGDERGNGGRGDAGEGVRQRPGEGDSRVGEAGRGGEPVGGADVRRDGGGPQVSRPVRARPKTSSTRPAVATTSASQRGDPERARVASCTSGRPNIALASTTPAAAPRSCPAT